MRRNHLRHKYMLGGTWLESSLAEKDLEILVDYKLNVNQQCTLGAKKVNVVLGFMSKSVASRLGQVSLTMAE